VVNVERGVMYTAGCEWPESSKDGGLTYIAEETDLVMYWSKPRSERSKASLESR
jgi:hypothetical protein